MTDDELLETAWNIIANGGWDGMAPSPGWTDAALNWRDNYFTRQNRVLHGAEDNLEHARQLSLLGKQVKVTLSRGGYPNPDSPATIVEGTLVGFGNEGTLEVLQEDGFIHYCWPMLQIEEVKKNDEGTSNP